MNIDAILLGKAIRELRELRGLTQREVAEAMGLTVNYLSLVENGKRGISIPHLNKLAEVLDVPASFITFLGSSPPKGKKLAAGLMNEIQQLVRNAVKLTTRRSISIREASLAHAH
jgi:transcriptional regulator with XRE-family HTH domain